jgi:type I restriction enzyme M protein
VAIKKSELYSSLWASCDELRGGMDASQYKDYVLVLLFVKYVSDRCRPALYAHNHPSGCKLQRYGGTQGHANNNIQKRTSGCLLDHQHGRPAGA